ncbi:MAG TPA: ABC transporter ATP-binding protein [Bryobacteraceae bacterium]|nr:ABC transporter ATP-binding protein [Bryobacteraceae bacterium]
MAPVIELDALEVRLGGRTILSKLTATLSGRAIGLLGPNGAGKSTLMNSLLGFYRPTSGTARIFGRDVRQHGRDLRRLIGYMPESDSFVAEMTAVRFVRMMAELSGLPPAEALERTHEAFYYVGLGEARYRPLGTYSLGMKQMAKLAQAIAHGPKLLFLDEPTNGLDPAARQRMIRLIQEIRDTLGIHIVISSHLLRDVEECCDEALIMRDGKVVSTCNLEEERRSNLNLIELEVDHEQNEFKQAIDALGCDYAALGHGRFRMVLREGLEVRDLYRIAAAHNIQIRKLSHRHDSLEDIFMKAMESSEATAGGRI